MTTHQKIQLYTDSLEKYLSAVKNHPGIKHGEEPSMESFGITRTEEIFVALKIAKSVRHDMSRSI